MSAPAKHLKVLILDDDSFMLMILSKMLQSLGCESIVACESALDALKHLAAPHAAFDTILLDINMPGMDGVEFIRRLAELQYSGSITLVSGEDDRILESVERLLREHKLRCQGRVQKPVQAVDLSRLIGQVTRGGGPLRAQHPAQNIDVVEQLQDAIDNEEIVNFYQPQVSLLTREIVGVECLVRWQSRHAGLIFPDQFVPAAEEHGLIGAVTQCVLAAAMRQAKTWQRAGHRFMVAVNISMHDLARLDFPDLAAELAESHGIAPSSVTMEVTEGQVMKRLSTVLDVLTRLRLKRFRLSMDDFGTGHSSLAQLRDLPFEELKIDRGFVHGASSNSTLRAICSASLRMAQQLRLSVVAEGIEEPDDWALLHDLGCSVGQGYLVGRPMPASELDSWLTDWEIRQGAAAPGKAM
ncbi:MAG TPA: EAL domain-containing response regulator [Steroidobacteraceae bacterium]|nr:EAL domain-containing response regulator [Steroidobacteraceae bacterium]